MKHKRIITSSTLQAIGLELEPEINEKYGNDKNKLEHAKAAQYYLQEYLRNMPIGMANLDDKKDLKNNLKTYIMGRIDGSIEPPERSPKTFFILEFILFSILSGIIGWIVRRYLDKLYPEK